MPSLGSERSKISKQRKNKKTLAALTSFFLDSFLKSAFPDCIDISSLLGVIGYVRAVFFFVFFLLFHHLNVPRRIILLGVHIDLEAIWREISQRIQAEKCFF